MIQNKLIALMLYCVFMTLTYAPCLFAGDLNARDIYTKKGEPESKRLAARFTLQLKQGNQFKEVSLRYKFHTGDEFRFIIRPNRDAYIYVININPEGEVHYVWPQENELTDTDNRIFRDKNNYIRPDDGVFYFSGTTGEDWLLVVLTPKQVAPKLSLFKQEFGKYKNAPNRVYEYEYRTDYNPRGETGLIDAPQSGDVGTYAAQRGSGNKALVYPYRLVHRR